MDISDIKFNYEYLFKINSPYDIRKLDVNDLPAVCDEVREFMIDVITKTGGHFGAGLGVVELTVAMHYVYNTPIDKIVFDTGHQGYPHKILTGRRDMLHTIRQKGGLSGFLKPSESEYDAFGAGHASTSISAALGLATARDYLNKKNKVIAVIGDGAMTGGMAYEAMNNIGFQKRDITVVLNDNDFSIDPNVSAISQYFNEVLTSQTAQKIRGNIWDITGRLDELGDRIRKVASKIEGGLKAIVTPGMLFEALGFKYYGPVEGHNVKKLVRMFKIIRDMNHPILLHIITQKGKGYAPAERDSQHYHAIGTIDKNTGKSYPVLQPKPKKKSYSQVFGSAMVKLCEMEPRLTAITAAMTEGTGLDVLVKEMPERVIDVGIAEPHAVTLAAGMAMEGMLPVCAIYSSFLQRAYDQINHDVALQNLHVIFALDRAGLVGSDGATHHGVLDMVYLRSIQNMIVMAPKDEQELRNMLYTAVFNVRNRPVSIRFPRGSGTGAEETAFRSITIGKAEIMRHGRDVAILAIGNTVKFSLEAADILQDMGIEAEIINARFVKPLDTDMLDDIANRFEKVITVEEGQIQGGFGSAVLEYLGTKHNRKVDVYLHGIPDKFIEHATQSELYHDLLLDGKGIARITEMFLTSGVKHNTLILQNNAS